MMLPTLHFLVDHLLRRGARAEGGVGFGGFSFDHVLDGAVMGSAPGEAEGRLVEVTGNSVTERILAQPCESAEVRPVTRTSGRTLRGKLPDNVIEFRPRRA